MNSMSNVGYGGQMSSFSPLSFMKSYGLYLLALIVFIVVGIWMYNTFKPSNDSTTYHANRENMVKEDSKVAVLQLFYTTWCPHCVKSKPEWESLKTEYEGKVINGYTLRMVEYDCDLPESETAMNKYNVTGFPTVNLIKDNQVIDYDAKLTKDTLEQFLHTVL